MKNMLLHTDKIAIQQLIYVLEKLGVENVVVSPGSRSAPIVQELNCYPTIQKTVIFDERSAAYFALGIAQQTNRVVAIVCTSGTALLNFAPAICEAFYQEIPLLVLTADRPLEMLNKGENQTINQFDIYHNYIKASFNLSKEKFDVKAILFALSYPRGPIHLNIPLAEPLYQTTETTSFDPKIVGTLNTILKLSLEQKNTLKEKWQSTQKKWIVIGKSNPNPERVKWLMKMEQSGDVIILSEPIANSNTKECVKNTDVFISSLLPNDAPSLIVTLGKQVLSKKLRTYLKTINDFEHWHVSNTGEDWDIFDKLSEKVACDEVTFLNLVGKMNERQSDYRNHLLNKYTTALSKVTNHSEDNWTDFTIFKKLSQLFEKNTIVQWGNSSVIRYASFFEYSAGVTHFANRGTSGIDGSLSTAVGCAVANSKNKVFAVLGDISFFYDSNALFIKPFPENLKVIVVNNGGGNIFRLIDGQKDEAIMQTYFETSHSHQTSHFASMFGLGYYFCDSLSSADDVLNSFFSLENKAAILELKTEAEKNVFTFKSYFKKLNHE